MKKLMYFVLVLCMSSATFAAMVTIAPPMTSPGKIGALCEVYQWPVAGPVWSAGSYVHTGEYPGTEIMTIGDYYNGFTGDAGVIKFDLSSAGIGTSTTINSAYFKGYGYSSSTSVYIKIQRYTGDNTTNLSASDLSASVVDVGVVLAPKDDNFSYDLTAAVAADVAAGKTYSSYLLTAVMDAAGTPLYGPNMPGEVYYSVIYAGWGDAQYLPRLEVDVVPEPATMALLMLGGVLLRRKKA